MKKVLKKEIKKKKLSKKQKVIIGFCLLLLVIILPFALVIKDIPSLQKLSSYQIPQTSKILDRNGELLYEIFTEQNRTLVKLDDIPDYLKNATIAIEDKDFYRHQGVNPIGGMLRAVKETIIHKKLQGGSTITQQLVKNALLTPERTVKRKIKEIILSFITEGFYSKDQILEMYFNQAPYGGTAWGIETAAERYFGKDVNELTLAQSALLAGLPRAPTLYSPFGAHPELAKKRQETVLERMVADKYITKEEKEKALAEKLEYIPQKTNIKAPHFVMYVKQKLVDLYGERLVEQGGLRVTTTLDLSLQEMAENTVATEIAKLEKYRVGNGAVLVTRPPTGEILAMVGSKDYFDENEDGNFNVTTSLRQPGSAIKPINYAIGIDLKTVTAASMFLDTPTCFQIQGQKPYCPVNYDGKFHGPQQLRFALGNSYNIPAVKMMALNGVEKMIASASAMGISSFKDPSNYGLSLTLGGGEVTMLDMAKAFGVFSNQGIRRELTSILKVEDNNEKLIYEFEDPNLAPDITKPISYASSLLIPGERVMSAETAFIISHILLDNGARSQMFGPSSSLVIKDKSVSVKTGTTDDKRDNWTIGYTPNFLTVVWVGNNDNSPMHPYLTSGTTGASPIWNKVMTFALKDQPDLFPKKPASVVGGHVCNVTGLKPPNAEGENKGCETRFEYFIQGTVPKDVENLKHVIPIDKSTNNIAPPDKTDDVENQEHQVIKDMFGQYCLDCSHEGGEYANTIRL